MSQFFFFLDLGSQTYFVFTDLKDPRCKLEKRERYDEN